MYYCNELQVTIPRRCVPPDMKYTDRKRAKYGSLCLCYKTSYTDYVQRKRKQNQSHQTKRAIGSRAPLLATMSSFPCSFQKKISQIIGWRPHSPRRVDAPPLGKPGSATVLE